VCFEQVTTTVLVDLATQAHEMMSALYRFNSIGFVVCRMSGPQMGDMYAKLQRQ
jgi:hypothetical protein